MDKKTKENMITIVGLLVSTLVIAGVIVGIIYLARSSTKKTKNLDQIEEKYQSSQSQEIRENYQVSTSILNALYTDENGNLGATSNLGLNSLNANTIYQKGSVLIPRGIIVMWNGSTSNIPEGWALCNGANGTPNLSGRFIVGVGSNGTNNYSSQDKGGSDYVTLTIPQLPSHTHVINDPKHSHGYTNNYAQDCRNVSASGTGGCWMSGPPGTNYPNTVASATGITMNETGSGQAHENRPSYFALCYIMKL